MDKVSNAGKKEEVIVGSAVNDLGTNWENEHAPLPQSPPPQNQNYLWWKQRAPRFKELPTIEPLTKATGSVNVINVEKLVGEVAASASVTVSNAGNLLAGGATSVAFVTTDGTTVTATAHAATTTTTNTNSPTFAVNASSANTTAANLQKCLNPNSKLSASVTTNVVTVTQLVSGAAGNSTVTLNDPGDAGLTKSNFDGGVTGTRITFSTTDGTSITAAATVVSGTTTNADVNNPYLGNIFR